MTEQSLALREAPALPSTTEWQTIVQMAGMLVPTGYLPASIKTAEQAVLIILKGRELNIPPLYALSNIVVVQGKPTCSAELMLALVYRDQGDLAVIVEESTAEVCRVTYRRRGWDRARSFAFTIADARTAELAGKGTWKQYPQAMLRARCISAVARLAFPDSIAGMYTPEELGAEVRVTDDGALEVDVRAEPAPQASLPPARPTTEAEPQTPRGPAIAAALDAAIAEADAVEAVVEPVTERTRMLCAAFVDAVHAANPKYKPKLPPDAAGDAAWRTWLEQKSEGWKTSELNPANKAVAAS